MQDNNFFGGGIGGTVTPRRRGGSIRWNGGLGADNTTNASTVDASSFIAGIGYVGIAYISVRAIASFYPKVTAKMDRITKKKGVIGVPEATVKGAQGITKEIF